MGKKIGKRMGKVSKASALYTREYGAVAYRDWLRREGEITKLANTGRYAVPVICAMRERNFRLMKAEGARLAAARLLRAA